MANITSSIIIPNYTVEGDVGPAGPAGDNAVYATATMPTMIVPATSSGTVISYENAKGKVQVYSGNALVTVGVTFQKISDIGLVSAIDSNGNYLVSSMGSSDTGTATYRATFNGVSYDVIVLCIKNKQGQQGQQGQDGAQGEDGKDGPPTGIVSGDTPPTGTGIPYIGMLWKNTGTGGGRIQNATYIWNGSSWELYTFQAQNILANSLSAISANLGTVNAGVINGVTINGSSFVSAFNNPYLGGTISGETRIKDGLYTASYTVKNASDVTQTTGTNQVYYTGVQTVMKVDGSNAKTITSDYNAEGVIMSDYRYTPTYGIVNMRYQDLMNVPPTNYDMYNSDWEPYDYGTNNPLVSRNGRLVQVTGALKNTVVINGGTSWIRVGTLPVWARPNSDVRFMAQGSGTYLFIGVCQPSGAILVARYRNGPNLNTAVTAGSWWNIACTFTAKDL